MPLRDLQQNLELKTGRKFNFKLNDNRSTMLSVRWEPNITKVSMHRMFLTAPQNVMDDLACYLLKKENQIAPTIKAFIETNLKKLDYTNLVDKSKLISSGSVYNLDEIYSRLNCEYFNRKLNLSITWFGRHNQKNRSRATFGLYHEPMKLIKIHRMLDSHIFPDYVVDFVVYHEMLHHVCPSYVDEKGITRIHSKAFKEKESHFKEFSRAQKWIKTNQTHFFANID